MFKLSNLRFSAIQAFIPIAMGIVAFILVAGLPMLNVTNIAWLGGNLDPAQHYLGWALFRIGPWTMPFGLNPNYGIEFSNAIVFSDSLPIFAFIFKPFSIFLPEVFQYFGLWTLLCFVLQAWFAWKLLGLVTDSLIFRSISTGLFLFSPIMMMRVGLWTSLASHFLILAALYLNIRANQSKRILLWVLLINAAALIHFYLLAMVLALWFSNLLDALLIQKKISFSKLFIELIIVLLTLLFCMWQAGYFSIGTSSGVGYGFGTYRLNLLAPIDARGWSYILPNKAMQFDAGNGFNFFGLGFLVAIFFALSGRIKFKARLPDLLQVGAHPFFYFSLFLLVLFSITNTIAIGYWHYTFFIPDSVVRVASILRATGRMFWPVFYFVLFITVTYIWKSYSRKSAILILSICFGIQVLDTSAGWWPIHQALSNKTSSTTETRLTDAIWKGFGAHYEKLVRFPLINHGEDWEYFASFAAINKMATNSAFLARFDEDKLKSGNQQISTQLREGPLDPGALYVLGPWKFNPQPIRFNPKSDVLAKINGFTVLAPGWKVCNTCVPVDSDLEMVRYAPITQIGKDIYFNRDSEGRNEFMLNGWIPYGEAWGSWTEGVNAGLILPVPSGKPRLLRIQLRAFVHEKHPNQSFEVFIDDAQVKKVSLDRFEGNVVEIALPQSLLGQEYFKLQIRLLNPASPKSLGISDDDRQLGIGLVSASFQ